jgi:hypothetical protein
MPSKIPFWRNVGAAFAFLAEDPGRFFRLGAVWIFVACLIYAAMVAIVGPAAIGSARYHDAGTAQGFAYSLVSVVFSVFRLLSGIAFAVAWHRAVLLDEAPPVLAAPRFQEREWRFLLYSIVVGLIVVGAMLLLAAVAFGAGYAAVGGHWLAGGARGISPRPAFLALAGGIFTAGFIAMLPFWARLTLGLPAIAVGEPRGVLGRAWHRGWRNGWRLFFGPALCALPFTLAAGILETVSGIGRLIAALTAAPTVVAWAVAVVFFALSYIASFLGAAAAVTFLANAYRHLTPPAAGAGLPP